MVVRWRHTQVLTVNLFIPFIHCRMVSLSLDMAVWGQGCIPTEDPLSHGNFHLFSCVMKQPRSQATLAHDRYGHAEGPRSWETDPFLWNEKVT